MISILVFMIFLTFIKLLIENKLLLILMTMEMASILTFFLLLSMNSEVLGLTSCTITVLSVMISESVLSLGLFMNLVRSSSGEKVSSMSLSY